MNVTTSAYATRSNVLKCAHTEAIVRACIGHHPAIEPVALAGLLASISLTCPSLTPLLVRVREQSGGRFSPLPAVLPGRDAAVTLPSCPQPLRFNGSVHGPRREDKVACGTVASVLPRKRSCLVVSVGSNGEPEFKESVHAAEPACAIDVWDGTLGKRKLARLQPLKFLTLHRRNFGPHSWRPYAGRRIALFKMGKPHTHPRSLITPPLA